MGEVLRRLNEKLQRRNGNILLLLDNALCHSPSLADRSTNITIRFPPKYTTSKTQPLDAGIIANWKVKYKKRLLRYVCSKVNTSTSASDIVKSINLPMIIEWGRQAWHEVSAETIKKCFKATNLYPEELEEGDDPRRKRRCTS